MYSFRKIVVSVYKSRENLWDVTIFYWKISGHSWS